MVQVPGHFFLVQSQLPRLQVLGNNDKTIMTSTYYILNCVDIIMLKHLIRIKKRTNNTYKQANARLCIHPVQTIHVNTEIIFLIFSYMKKKYYKHTMCYTDLLFENLQHKSDCHVCKGSHAP